MQIFAKLFYGFDPENIPIISFGKEGSRDRLLREAKPGDLIVFVGTTTDDTAPEEQGRVLGMAEIGRNAVDTVEILGSDHVPDRFYDKKGVVRWPKSIPMLRAWRFPEKPKASEFFGERLTQAARNIALKLSDKDQENVLALDAEPVELKLLGEPQRQQRTSDLLSGRASSRPPSGGIPPTSWDANIEFDPNRPAYVYALQFGDSHIWKIGWAFDPAMRLKAINAHIPVELLKADWKLVYQQRCPNACKAYQLEQAVLGGFEKRGPGERVECDPKAFLRHWTNGLVA